MIRGGDAGGAGGVILLLGAALALACADAPREPWPEIEPEVPSPLRQDRDRRWGAQDLEEAEEEATAADGGRETLVVTTRSRRLDVRGPWYAPPCGRRNYARQVYFSTTGQVRVEERVSPCPRGTVCVWSGVEVVKGSFQREGDRLDLALDPIARDLAVEPPATLAVVRDDDGDRVLEDAEGCRYYRAFDDELEQYLADEISEEDEEGGPGEPERPRRP